MSGREPWTTRTTPRPRIRPRLRVAHCAALGAGCSCSSGSSPPRAARITPPGAAREFTRRRAASATTSSRSSCSWSSSSCCSSSTSGSRSATSSLQAAQRQKKGTYARCSTFLPSSRVVAAVPRAPAHPRHRRKQAGSEQDRSSRQDCEVAERSAEAESGCAATAAFKWLPVSIATAAGLAVLGFIGVRSVRRERRGLAEQHALELEFEELSRTRSPTSTPRRIRGRRSSRRMRASSGSSRRTASAATRRRRRSSTSSASFRELRAIAAALGRLTGLFEWAKFSAHDVDHSMRDEAIEALTRGARRAAREPARG